MNNCLKENVSSENLKQLEGSQDVALIATCIFSDVPKLQLALRVTDNHLS
jgi:hypothetical protein